MQGVYTFFFMRERYIYTKLYKINASHIPHILRDLEFVTVVKNLEIIYYNVIEYP